jgi:hypothetical protein
MLTIISPENQRSEVPRAAVLKLGSGKINVISEKNKIITR